MCSSPRGDVPCGFESSQPHPCSGMTPAWLNDEAIKLVSFDVFDTVIARRCGAPESIFRIAGEKLRQRQLLSMSPAAFETMRMQAELRARQHKGVGELTLAEIYRELNSL